MPASRTPEHDVAKHVNVIIGFEGHPTASYDHDLDCAVLEIHRHVGADLRGQTNEEAGKWIKAIIDRVVKRELET